jgi:hypothetical protein
LSERISGSEEAAKNSFWQPKTNRRRYSASAFSATYGTAKSRALPETGAKKCFSELCKAHAEKERTYCSVETLRHPKSCAPKIEGLQHSEGGGIFCF